MINLDWYYGYIPGENPGSDWYGEEDGPGFETIADVKDADISWIAVKKRAVFSELLMELLR